MYRLVFSDFIINSVKPLFYRTRCYDCIRFYNTKRIDITKHPEYSLAAFIPESVKQWDNHLNGDLKPSQIPYNYDGTVWWHCPHGDDHIWKSVCKARVDQENKRLLDCPFCSNKRISRTNSLLTKYPQLASEFDMLSNNGLKASDVIYNRKKPYYWRCIHNHTYKMTIPKRLQYMEEGVDSCPICHKKENPSSLLYDYNPELFEESYNWLNCPSLPPENTSIISNPSSNEGNFDYPIDDQLPDDILKPIDFQELYVDYDETTSIKEEEKNFQKKESLNVIDRSLQRSLQNHILEYQKWKESIHWNDNRIIWWVCRQNPTHIWRESVKSRVSKYCPFCYHEHRKQPSLSPSVITDDSIVTFYFVCYLIY